MSTKRRSKQVPSSLLPVILKEIRLAEDLSQRDMGLRLDVSQSCINRWERGTRVPSRDELIRIGHLLRITWILQ